MAPLPMKREQEIRQRWEALPPGVSWARAAAWRHSDKDIPWLLADNARLQRFVSQIANDSSTIIGQLTAELACVESQLSVLLAKGQKK